MMTAKCADGSVGVFWVVPTRLGNLLIAETQPLAEAEPYGTFLTFSQGHYDVWEGWRKRTKGVPAAAVPAIVFNEYEDFPRGRVVFDANARVFVIYIDRSLDNPSNIENIRQRFSLEGAQCVVRYDAHYRLTGA